MAKKRKKKDNLKYIKPAVVLAGGSAGASLIGSALPAGAGSGLAAASTGMASMVAPVAVVGGAAMTMKYLKMLPKVKKKRKRR